MNFVKKNCIKTEFWFGLWCLTPFSTIFQLYHGGQFDWWRKPEYPEKTTDPEFFMQGRNYYYDFICLNTAFSENSIKKRQKYMYL